MGEGRDHLLQNKVNLRTGNCRGQPIKGKGSYCKLELSREEITFSVLFAQSSPSASCSSKIVHSHVIIVI
jgi:hypothetical protein